MKIKKSLMAIAVVALFFVIVLTYFDFANANLTFFRSKRDSVTLGGNNITIHEEYDQLEEINPGDVINKSVSVENSGNGDCYVRIKAVYTHNLIESYSTIDWNTSDFTYNSTDEYWYYNKVLKTGETTENLFTKISINEDISKDIENFNIIVYAESIQARGYANADEAWVFFNSQKQEE